MSNPRPWRRLAAFALGNAALAGLLVAPRASLNLTLRSLPRCEELTSDSYALREQSALLPFALVFVAVPGFLLLVFPHLRGGVRSLRALFVGGSVLLPIALSVSVTVAVEMMWDDEQPVDFQPRAVEMKQVLRSPDGRSWAGMSRECDFFCNWNVWSWPDGGRSMRRVGSRTDHLGEPWVEPSLEWSGSSAVIRVVGRGGERLPGVPEEGYLAGGWGEACPKP